METWAAVFFVPPLLRNQKSSKNRFSLVREGAKGLLGIKKGNPGFPKITCNARQMRKLKSCGPMLNMMLEQVRRSSEE